MVTTITREITTETIHSEPEDTSYDPVLRKALERKDAAEEALKNVEGGHVDPDGGGMYCCMYHKKHAVNLAKKHLKHWNDFLATRATLTASQLDMELAMDDDEDDEEDDDQREIHFYRAGI